MEKEFLVERHEHYDKLCRPNEAAAIMVLAEVLAAALDEWITHVNQSTPQLAQPEEPKKKR